MAPLPPPLAERVAARQAREPRLAAGAAMLAEAREALAARQAEDAAMLADTAFATAPGDAALGLDVALLNLRLLRPAAALAAAAPALAAEGDAALADRLGMLGEGLARNGALGPAVAVLRAAWRRSPRPIMRRVFLEAALPAYRRSLNEGADAALLEAATEAAASAIAAMPEAALAELARLAEEAGRDDLLRALGAAALAAGDEARARLLAGIGPAEAPNAAGLALLATGRTACAGLAFAIAHHAAPEDAAARLNAGYAALAGGDAVGAADILCDLPACGEAAMAGAAWPHLGELPWPFAPLPAAARAALDALLPAGAWPRIRLVTPCFNPGPWLEETILSVAHQHYPALEHVVVDACSTDGTAEVLARHRHRLHAVIVEPDSGPAEAICKGLAGTEADLLGWINADDLLAPGALHRLGAAFAAAPDADIVHGSALPHRGRRILGHQVPLADGAAGFTTEALADVFDRWAEGRFFLQPEALLARRFWDRLGGRLDTSLAAVFDYEMWLRAAALAPRIVRVAWPTAFYRIHAAQRTAGRAALAEEQVAVRDRFAAPAPPPARLAALRARLRGALAGRPRLLLIDQWCAETIAPAAREEARASLAALGVALEIRAQLPAGEIGADIVLRLLRAHDGADWVATLRGRDFAGPVLGWLLEDDRDPYANAAIAAGLDLVLPARAERRSALLQDAAAVLPAIAPPGPGGAGLGAALAALVGLLRAEAARD